MPLKFQATKHLQHNLDGHVHSKGEVGLPTELRQYLRDTHIPITDWGPALLPSDPNIRHPRFWAWKSYVK